MSGALLEVVDLVKNFHVGSRLAPGGRQVVQALAGVSFEVFAGETLGLVASPDAGNRRWGGAF